MALLDLRTRMGPCALRGARVLGAGAVDVCRVREVPVQGARTGAQRRVLGVRAAHGEGDPAAAAARLMAEDEDTRMSATAIGVVWVTVGTHVMLDYHSRAQCSARDASKRIPTAEAAAVQAGFPPCAYCTEAGALALKWRSA